MRNAPEKLFVLRYPQLTPPTLITRDRVELRAFRREHGDIILKPLYGNGGAGVFRLGERTRISPRCSNSSRRPSASPSSCRNTCPTCRKGDKRIILVDGEAVGAINRVPAVGENRSNMHVGGKARTDRADQREHEICEAIGPELKARGLIFVGIDVIGDYLTEINVTSPTGIREVKRFGGADIAALIWDAIEARR